MLDNSSSSRGMRLAGAAAVLLLCLGIGTLYFAKQQWRDLQDTAGSLGGQTQVRDLLQASSIEQSRKDALLVEVDAYTVDLTRGDMESAELAAVMRQVLGGFIDDLSLVLPLEERVIRHQPEGAARQADLAQIHRLWYALIHDELTDDQRQRVWILADGVETPTPDTLALGRLSDAGYTQLIDDIRALCDAAGIPADVPPIDYAEHFRRCRDAAPVE